VTTTSECSRFLRGVLSEGPRQKTEIARIARELGFSDKALRTARENLGVRSQRYGFGPGSAAWWSLPEGGEARAPAYVPRGHDGDDEGTYAHTSTDRAAARLRNTMPPGEVIDPEFPFGNEYDRAALANWSCSACGGRSWWRAKSGRTYCARCSPPRG
jgi:hypothetical protein